MNRDSIDEILVELWDEGLDDARREVLERRLAELPDADGRRAELERLWARLGELENDPPTVPSEPLRARFYPALDEARRRLERPSFWRRWLGAAPTAALRPALASFGLGVALGALLVWVAGARSDVRRLTDEMQSMTRAVSLSLLEHQSASERLRGVGWSSRVLADDRIVEALLDAVRNDPNVNVRLAALDTLADRIDSPRVRAGLIDTLPRQESPLLQVAMVEILRTRNGSGDAAIRELLDQEDLDEDVRARIQDLMQSI